MIAGSGDRRRCEKEGEGEKTIRVCEGTERSSAPVRQAFWMDARDRLAPFRLLFLISLFFPLSSSISSFPFFLQKVEPPSGEVIAKSLAEGFQVLRLPKSTPVGSLLSRH